MQPLKPEDKEAALHQNPSPDAAELMQEYENLLADRFNQDPDSAVAAAPESMEAGFQDLAIEREKRLKVLHKKLFSPSSKRDPRSDEQEGEKLA